MSYAQLTDPAIHAWLCGATVAGDLQWLARRTALILSPVYRENAIWALYHAGRSPGRVGFKSLLANIYQVCPRNLAERIHEGLNVYQLVGKLALPPLLQLLGPMAQAELHLYSHLKTGKPYRDHLVHATRVAGQAHLFFSRPDELGFPEALRVSEILRRRWVATPEFHLLRHYAANRGIILPDPREMVPRVKGRGLESRWEALVRAAGLLAGLLHDLGYIHKALGDVAERAAAAVPWISFVPEVSLEVDPAETPLQGLYEAVCDVTLPGQVYAPLKVFLRQHYRELHSIVGALWLASLPLETAPPPGEDPAGSPAAHRADAELVFQLAAMMAFSHDLALSDKARRKQLALRKDASKDLKDRDVINLQDFPLCTLFTLSDVLQEYGRTVQVVDGNRIRHVVPMPGIRLEGMPADSPEKVSVRYLTKIAVRKKSSLLPSVAVSWRKKGTWKETEVGKNVCEWLKRAGLSDHVDLPGDPDQKKRLAAYDPDIRRPAFLGRALVR